MLFCKALFLATPIPEIVGGSFFNPGFFQQFQNFLKIFPTICAFRPNTRNLKACFIKNFEKYAKIIHLCNFPKTF